MSATNAWDNIDDEAVTTNAANLITAIPRFAKRAAMTARFPFTR